MRAQVWYKHTEENYVFQGPYRKADDDEMLVQFIPEGDEVLPFPNGESMIPFADFVKWFEERAEMEQALNIVGVETAEPAEIEEVTENA